MQSFLQIVITLLITLTAVVFATMMFHKVAGTLNPTKLNIVSYTYYTLLVFSVIGSMFIGMGLKVHYHQWAIRHWETDELVWQLILITFLTMPIIMYFMGRWLKFNPRQAYERYVNAPIASVGGERDKGAFLVMLVASAVCLLAVVYTFMVIGLQNNPILNLIRGTDAETLARLRNMAGSQFRGNVLFRNIFAITLTPVMSYIALGYSVKTKRWPWILMFVVLFFTSCLIKFYNLEKAPILYYFISLFILLIYCGLKIDFKWVLRLGIFFAIAIVVMYLKIAGTDPARIFSLTTGPINRIFITSTIALFYHFEIFTYLKPLLGGASFPSLISVKLLGLDKQVRSGEVVMNLIAPNAVEDGTAGVYNCLFLGEAYGNFSWPGVVFAIIWISVVIYGCHILFMRLKKTPITMAAYAYFTHSMVTILHGGFVDYIYNPNWFIVVVTLVAMTVASKILDKFFEVVHEKMHFSHSKLRRSE